MALTHSILEDIEAWLDQLKLILELQKAGGASVYLATVILLFLEGQAYDLYAELGPDVHANADSLEGTLRVAFGLSPFMAFTKFKACSLREGKTPDAFLAELCRLAQVICHEGAAGVDKFVVCQFIDGLPEPAQSQLKASHSHSHNKWEMVLILQCVKVLLAEHDEGGAKGFASCSESPFIKVTETSQTKGVESDEPVMSVHCDRCR